ncbi:MAG: hypothetical protein ACXABY_18295, partial [Candidatus Thorarchaeota archaeon]
MSSETITHMANEEKVKVWAIGDPWNLFFGEPEELTEKPTGELTIDDLSVKGPKSGWDRLIVERPAEEILYYR